MSVELLQPHLSTEPAPGKVSLERSDIRFANRNPERLSIEVTFRNAGESRSEPTVALITSAPLGAFVPWRPLDVARIPELPPGGSFIYRKDVSSAPAVALGTPDRLPPRALLTAAGAGNPQGQGKNLAVDLMRLVGQGSTHWAGNLNIFIGGREVERHMAQALRVYPGKVNLAAFIVGDGKPDGYSFELLGDAAAWDARLIDASFAPSMLRGAEMGDYISESGWREMSHGFVLLAMEPPGDVVQGAVEVHVCQRSSGKTAVVEFSLDASAAGPGCYVL
jgi:hypothetical protein